MTMDTRNLLRHQIIKSLLAHHMAKGGGGAILLWEQLATQLISLIGEDGFVTLYDRSVVLAKAIFPWLELSAQPMQISHRFAELRSSLDGQSAAAANAANSLLLITFTDIIAALIGEEMSINTLHSAWGHVVDKQVKGQKNG